MDELSFEVAAACEELRVVLARVEALAAGIRRLDLALRAEIDRAGADARRAANDGSG